MDSLKSMYSSFRKKGTASTDREQSEKPPKSINIAGGFFLLVNFIVGTGFLGIPFAFYHTGLLAAALTLMVTVFITWNSCIWVLEVMARAQVTNYFLSRYSIYTYMYVCVIKLTVYDRLSRLLSVKGSKKLWRRKRVRNGQKQVLFLTQCLLMTSLTPC